MAIWATPTDFSDGGWCHESWVYPHSLACVCNGRPHIFAQPVTVGMKTEGAHSVYTGHLAAESVYRDFVAIQKRFVPLTGIG